MHSFVRPSFAAKFGLAAATSAAMVAAPLAAIPASAATISVTTCDGAALLAAVDTADGDPTADTIAINVSGDCTMTINSRIDISTSMTITNINPTDDLIIKRNNGNGEVVHVRNMNSSISVVLDNLTITGFSADTNDQDRLIEFDGESLYPSTLIISDSTVSNGDSGGVNIYRGSLTVEDSFFTSNLKGFSDRNGGAIRARESTVSIADTTFDSNGFYDLDVNGGAVFADDSTLTIEASTFTGNLAGWGGAVYIKDTDLEFEGAITSFSGNGVTLADFNAGLDSGHAGAIDVHGVSTFIANAPLAFDGNMADDGGAIRFKLEADTTVEFNGSVHFRDNLADSDGGAIEVYVYVYDDFDVQVEFEFNGAVTYFGGNQAGSDGGAIAIKEDGNNSDYSVDTVEEQLVMFSFNSATTTFNENYAGDDGGAIYAYGYHGFAVLDFIDEVTPREVFFTNNESDDDGGAIYLEGGDYADGLAKLFLDGASFTGNTAAADGTIYLEGAQSYVLNSYFANNTAVDGGIFYLEDDNNASYLFVLNSEFYNNSASGRGGIFYLEDESGVVAYGNLFHENSAVGAGSIMFMQQDTTDENRVYFYQNTVYENHSETESAALHLGRGTTGSIGFNTFVDNSSVRGNLALSVDIDAYSFGLSIVGNIFASQDDGDVVFTGESDRLTDLGANLLTGDSGQSLNGGTAVEDYSLALRDGRSLIATWDQLDLQPLRLNNDNPSNASPLQTIALGEFSVAVDFLPTSVEDWSTFTPINDNRGVTRHSPGGVEYGTGIDVGAFESMFDFTPVDEEPPVIDPNLVITHVSKDAIQAAGDTIVVYGSGLDDVTELFFNSTKVSFVLQADGSLLATTGVMPVGEVLITAYASDGTAVLQFAFFVVDTLEFSTWTRRVGDTIKVYAKNIIGSGKVQMFVDGREIAWVNAVDATDPKLRTANGYHYLVRTVQLKADGSKTRFEVKLNGERVRRNTYTINAN